MSTNSYYYYTSNYYYNYYYSNYTYGTYSYAYDTYGYLRYDSYYDYSSYDYTNSLYNTSDTNSTMDGDPTVRVVVVVFIGTGIGAVVLFILSFCVLVKCCHFHP